VKDADRWLADEIARDAAIASHAWDGDTCLECGLDGCEIVAGAEVPTCVERKTVTGSRWHRTVREVRARDEARRKGIGRW
jgi:hypothetical protein